MQVGGAISKKVRGGENSNGDRAERGWWCIPKKNKPHKSIEKIEALNRDRSYTLVYGRSVEKIHGQGTKHTLQTYITCREDIGRRG